MILIKSLYFISVSLLLIHFTLSTQLLYSVEVKKITEHKKNKIKPRSRGESTYIQIGSNRLSLSDAMKLVIFKNLTLREAMYDLIQVDTKLLKFQKKYKIKLGLEGKLSYSKKPVFAEILRSIQGDTATKYDIVGSIRKKFSTGTEIIGGINNINYYDVNDQAFQGSSPNPAFYRHGFFLQIKQELLKNFLGQTDRANEKSLEIRASITRSSLINQLSSILVQTIADYWSVTVSKKALDTRLLELSSTRKVRQIIIRNTRLGISEKFDVNRYNSLLAVAKNKVAQARYQYEEVKRILLRRVDLSPTTKITGVTDLTEKLPADIKLSKDIETAFKKRVDYKNAILEMKAIKLEKEVSSNALLPSLLLDFKVETASQADSLKNSFYQAHNYEFPNINLKLKMNYPLFDREMYANRRNSELKMKQQEIVIMELKKELRDDVISKHGNLILSHKVLKNSKIAQRESAIYYAGLLKRSRQGKFNAENVKNALDSVINSRLRLLQNLVNYNLALLQYDLSKNEIFERYDLNIEKLLKQMKL